MASLSAVAFLSRGEIGGNKGHLGVPPMTYLGVVWTKVGDCGDKEARSAGTSSSSSQQDQTIAPNLYDGSCYHWISQPIRTQHQ